MCVHETCDRIYVHINVPHTIVSSLRTWTWVNVHVHSHTRTHAYTPPPHSLYTGACAWLTHCTYSHTFVQLQLMISLISNKQGMKREETEDTHTHTHTHTQQHTAKLYRSALLFSYTCTWSHQHVYSAGTYHTTHTHTHTYLHVLWMCTHHLHARTCTTQLCPSSYAGVHWLQHTAQHMCHVTHMCVCVCVCVYVIA